MPLFVTITKYQGLDQDKNDMLTGRRKHSVKNFTEYYSYDNIITDNDKEKINS